MGAKLRILFWIGIVLLFLPYIGVPDSWRKVILFILAAALLVLTFRLRKAYKILRLKLKRFEQPVVDEAIHS